MATVVKVTAWQRFSDSHHGDCCHGYSNYLRAVSISDIMAGQWSILAGFSKYLFALKFFLLKPAVVNIL